MSVASRSGSMVVGLWLLVGCSGQASEDGPGPDSASSAPAACGEGTWIDSEAGGVCVFGRDLPLVIEGGFSCPASLDHRVDTATAIACAEQRMSLLPAEVCAEIDGACDSAQSDRAVGGAPVSAASLSERVGGPGECVVPCDAPTDCVPPIGAPGATRDADNYACTEGACVYRGCVDDAECETDHPGTLCRAEGDGPSRCADPCESDADCGAERGGERDIGCVDGACVLIGCEGDAECRAPGQCADRAEDDVQCEPGVCAPIDGLAQCAFPCESAEDCARRAQEELGLSEPDPNDPYTSADGLLCRHGLCRVKPPGCNMDSDCGVGSVCRLPGDGG